MKLLYRISPLVIALLLAGCAATPSKPAYAPANGGFSVQMPAAVREEQVRDGAHIYGCESNGIAYLVSYNEIPKAVAGVAPNRLFDAARSRVVRSGKARVTREEKGTIDGHPARDLYLKTAGGYFMRLKMAVTAGRLYQVSAVTTMDKANAPEIASYIDSFHFTKQ